MRNGKRNGEGSDRARLFLNVAISFESSGSQPISIFVLGFTYLASGIKIFADILGQILRCITAQRSQSFIVTDIVTSDKSVWYVPHQVALVRVVCKLSFIGV